MQKWKMFAGTMLLVALGIACNRSPKNPEVEKQINQSLNAAGLRDVTADQNAAKGVVTLTGEVTAEGDKIRAEEIAKSAAAGQIVANQISVRPPGQEDQMKDTQSALDDGIESNYKAALVKNRLKGVDYKSKEGVLTLTGSVDTTAQRKLAEKLASDVPNVKQVVNELKVSGEPFPATTRH
jgi:hyperosmotically inducible periplasmic protein